MVTLSRIYTKTGDQGETHLGDMSRVGKDHPRVAAYGTVDELNATLGLLVASDANLPERELLLSIQNDLFDLGADLCVPLPKEPPEYKQLRIAAEQVVRLEKAIDRLNEPLTTLQSFILPGGSAASAWAHLARTVCRRAERDAVALTRTEEINPQAVIYLNRLSDLLFVLGRVYNNQGKDDVLWKPGLTQS